MEKQKTRDQIDDKYKWDLTTIYKTDEIWYEELDHVSKKIEKVTNYKGKITASAKNLLDYLQFDETLERRLYKLYY